MKRRSNACAAMLIRSMNEMELARLEMNSAKARYYHLEDHVNKKASKFFGTVRPPGDGEIRRMIARDYPNLGR